MAGRVVVHVPLHHDRVHVVVVESPRHDVVVARRRRNSAPAPARSASAGALVKIPSDGRVSRDTQGSGSGGVPGRVGGCVCSGLKPSTPTPS